MTMNDSMTMNYFFTFNGIRISCEKRTNSNAEKILFRLCIPLTITSPVYF